MTIGLNIVIHGQSRPHMGGTVFAVSLVPMFAKTIQPGWSIYAFGLFLFLGRERFVPVVTARVSNSHWPSWKFIPRLRTHVRDKYSPGLEHCRFATDLCRKLRRSIGVPRRRCLLSGRFDTFPKRYGFKFSLNQPEEVKVRFR